MMNFNKKCIWLFPALLLAFVSCSTDEEFGVANIALVGELPDFLQIGETLQLNVNVVPGNATNPNLIFRSSDNAVAEVDEEGLVRGLSDGNVTITVISQDNPALEDSINLLVNDGTFKMLWNGVSEITIRTNPDFAGQYNYDVDFDGDGIPNQSGVEGDVTFNFGAGNNGPHIVSISGDFPAIQFGVDDVLQLVLSEDKDTVVPFDATLANSLIEIQQWGIIEWRSMNKAFASCENLLVPAVDVPNFTEVDDMSNMFRNAFEADPDVSQWNVEKVIDMTSMFEAARRANPDMSNWKITKELLQMQRMLDTSGIAAINYANALNNFAKRAEQELINTITLGAAEVEFCSFAQEARTTLELSRNWEFVGENGPVECPEQEPDL